jgi:hypothetical protein
VSAEEIELVYRGTRYGDRAHVFLFFPFFVHNLQPVLLSQLEQSQSKEWGRKGGESSQGVDGWSCLGQEGMIWVQYTLRGLNVSTRNAVAVAGTCLLRP